MKNKNSSDKAVTRNWKFWKHPRNRSSFELRSKSCYIVCFFIKLCRCRHHWGRMRKNAVDNERGWCQMKTAVNNEDNESLSAVEWAGPDNKAMIVSTEEAPIFTGSSVCSDWAASRVMSCYIVRVRCSANTECELEIGRDKLLSSVGIEKQKE